MCARRGGYDVGLERGRFRLVGLTLAALLPLVACATARAQAPSLPSLPPLPSLTVPVSPVPVGPVPVGPTPIPSVALGAPPSYEGAPADPQPVRGTGTVPQNPFMAPNGESEIHDDGWQTDAFAWSGPLGRSPQTLSSYLAPGRDCGSIAFDSHGRVVSICISTSGPELYMFDPSTLATLATFSLPLRTPEDLLLNPNIFQDFSNGGYFYLDNHDQVVTATTTQHIYVIGETAGGEGFALVHDYDLSSVLTSEEEITSALPDSNGLLWFVARRDGVVGTLDLSTGDVHVIRLGSGSDGEIENSFATDQHGGVYIATNRKLYRFGAGAGDVPEIEWQITYPNSGEHKPGQVDDGTGSTPTVMPGGYVNITDNADPMDVMVYRTQIHVRRRQVCRVPVFDAGASANENSLIGAGRSMIVENNYGYQSPASVEGGQVTAAGFARVDLNRSGTGCRLVWTNRTERAPTVVSKLSTADGLIYTYTKDPGSSDPWYWTAIDFRTGRTVYKQLAGTGVGYNNNYSGIAVSPAGTEYVGTLGGLIALRDR